jgi:predicted phosphodiesterase
VKYAIVSDIHANLDALEAVLARIDPTDAIYCLGDIVGYGPQPNECVDRVRERAAVTILGNHDVAALDGHGIALFNDNARDAIRWTQTVLSEENVAWLDALSYEYRAPEYLLVHGAPVDYFRYVMNEEAARDAFGATDAPIVFIGHTHVAGYFALRPDGSLSYEARREGGTLALEPGTRYIVDVGSVGQPRDRNRNASFIRYDPQAATIRWERVPYAVATTQQKMTAANLPGALARRLDTGR